jgi:hypothetical protein
LLSDCLSVHSKLVIACASRSKGSVRAEVDHDEDSDSDDGVDHLSREIAEKVLICLLNPTLLHLLPQRVDVTSSLEDIPLSSSSSSSTSTAERRHTSFIASPAPTATRSRPSIYKQFASSATAVFASAVGSASEAPATAEGIMKTGSPESSKKAPTSSSASATTRVGGSPKILQQMERSWGECIGFIASLYFDLVHSSWADAMLDVQGETPNRDALLKLQLLRHLVRSNTF